MSQDPGVNELIALVEQQASGVARGIYSVCSANRFVLEACIQQAEQDGSALLIESTSNQVNQFGGYTGMSPGDFRDSLLEIASKMGFPKERIILGGDHLGPNPWQAEAEGSAMEKARQLVRACVEAGYVKLHLDASMRLGDDHPDQPLDRRLAARRAAELCQVAEETCRDRLGIHAPVYVIGTEVPPPGGALERGHSPQPTRVEDAQETLELTRKSFIERGLEKAWERVLALVVQPGVEFEDQEVYTYHRAGAAPLVRFIQGFPGLVYEAHSTDYQTRQALKQMVEDRFAILKVGPGLTFAFREAVFALAMIEEEWLAGRSGVQLSGLIRVMDTAMQRDPRYWKAYYHGENAETKLARKYSYSDRIRYYWPDPGVKRALSQLLHNLEQYPVPLTLISQFMPGQYQRLRAGQLGRHPIQWIYDRIREVTRDYAWACDPTTSALKEQK